MNYRDMGGIPRATLKSSDTTDRRQIQAIKESVSRMPYTELTAISDVIIEILERLESRISILEVNEIVAKNIMGELDRRIQS